MLQERVEGRGAMKAIGLDMEIRTTIGALLGIKLIHARKTKDMLAREFDGAALSLP